MTDTKKQGDSGGINPIVAGVVGAAVGAAATVAAVELANEDNRKALGDKMGEIKEGGEKIFDGLKDTAIKARDEVLDLSAVGKQDDVNGSNSKTHN